MENEANAANIEELTAHIQRTGAKLGGMNPGTEQYGETKELLEDYYERLVSIKNMSINTLQERLTEAEAEHNERERNLKESRSRLIWTIIILSALLIFLAEVFNPNFILGPLYDVSNYLINSTPATIAATAITAHLCTVYFQ